MSEFGRELWGYLRAVVWRLGIHRPTQLGSYIRYIGPVDQDRLSGRIQTYLRRLCWIGGLRAVRSQEYRHLPNDDAVRMGDPSGLIGSVGWKVDVL